MSAQHDPQSNQAQSKSWQRPWKSVWFQCCHTYGRMYRNLAATKYEGRCPKCGAVVHATIGPGGSSARMFKAK